MAFYPLLGLGCMVLGGAIWDPDHGSTAGNLVGLAASVPIAFLIDRRRQHRATRTS